jgi:GT2 family glycosyltransferase
MFLDNDQFVHQGWLEQYKDFMTEKRFDVIGADAWLMNNSFMPIKNCKNLGEPYSYVGCGGMMLKRNVVDTVGVFDEQFNPAYFEDPDYNFRARKNNFRIGWNYLAKITHLPHQTLGKNKNKANIFAESYKKFRNKWLGFSMQPMRCDDVYV